MTNPLRPNSHAIPDGDPSKIRGNAPDHTATRGGHVPLGVAGDARDKSLIDRIKERNADQQPSDNTANFEMS